MVQIRKDKIYKTLKYIMLAYFPTLGTEFSYFLLESVNILKILIFNSI